MVFIQRLCWKREMNGSWDDISVKPRLSLYRVFNDVTCYKADEHCMTAAEDGEQPPLPFSCAFSRQSGASHLVAVANEDGKVHLIDTLKKDGGCVRTWQAHVNAVFDIAWVEGENKLVTASGDQTAQLWDVERSKCISVFKGHSCSLRSISFKQNHPNVFATGARDGNVMLWDSRNRAMKSGYFKPVNILHGVHCAVTTGQTASRRSTRNTTDAQQSVTSVLFRDENSLYSSGAADGVVKMWDVRRYYTNSRGVPQAKHVYPYVGSATRKHGISSLSLTSCGSYLFSSCTDDCIYVYNTLLETRDPVSVLTGHTNSTFYVKTSVTCDNRYLVSGSSSHSVFIWDIAKPGLAPVKLDGHSGEVTSVACSPTDIGVIVSCSDDLSARIWRLHDQTSLCKEGFRVGSASTLANHTPVPLSALNLVEREVSTPARTATPRTATPSQLQEAVVTPSQSVKTVTPSQSVKTLTLSQSLKTVTPSQIGCHEDAPTTSATISLESVTTPKRKVNKRAGVASLRVQSGNSPASSPLRHSPRTPGKISAYFKTSGLLSTEKKSSPLRQSPRLQNKIAALLPKSTVKPLDLNEKDSLKNRSPRKVPKRKERVRKSSLVQPDGEVPESSKTASIGIQSPGSECSSAGTQSEMRGVTIATQTSPLLESRDDVETQTLSPADCSMSCVTCCRQFAPLKLHTPNLPSSSGNSQTPDLAARGFTPRSCSSSSIPRPKRIHSDLPTTPTRGCHAQTRMRSPDGKENYHPTSTRKFTRTGTPIHRNNCRCTFCLSSAVEVSELSSSPILEMPSRPRKRLLSHELGCPDHDPSSKKRKSLFSGDEGVTVSQWLGQHNSDPMSQLSQEPLTQDSSQSDPHNSMSSTTGDPTVNVYCSEHSRALFQNSSQTSREDENCTQRTGREVVSQDDDPDSHDQSQCSSMHCLRYYFNKTSN